MKIGVLISVVVGVLAASVMMMAFLNNASPYVTIAEAKTSTANGLHVIGDLDKTTLFTDLAKSEVRFTMTDANGGRMDVIYDGPAPSNMGEATQVVAIGGMKDGVFHARQLNLKCPSKYEGKEKE
ncbi:MAG: cytochrome c maturation protein CcmE [Armatimonadetes bacterium]|nr:cytochrome c maturation protein CcmE [Armatimonadota bacterium]